MSVIVYGMKMPEHCGYCRFRYDSICHALQKTRYNMDECPLVPIPKHGRLIDTKSLENMHFTESMHDKDGKLFVPFVEVASAIFDAPTIIPAEQEDT